MKKMCILACVLWITLSSLVSSQTTPKTADNCMKKIMKCPPIPSNTDELCRKGPAIIKCMEEILRNCQDPTMAKHPQKALESFNVSYHKNCPGTCTEEFNKCITDELGHASQHRDIETLCSKGPEAITCLEKCLASYVCASLDEKQKQPLRSHLASLKSNVTNNCEKGSAGRQEKPNGSSSRRFLSCTGLGLALLLHRV